MRPLVLHLLPFDLARGAQVYAQALRDVLDDPTTRHEIVTLFASPQAVLRPAFPLGVPMGRWRRTGYHPRVLVRLARCVGKERPAALIAHGSEPLKYALLLPKRPPVVAVRIGVSELGDGLRARLFGRQLRAADALVGVSGEVIEESTRRFGVPGSRCVLIPNGRDATVFRPPDGPRPDPPGVLFVGHFDANKRPELFIATVETLRRRGVPLTATMIGGGPLWEGLKPRAEVAGVTMLGRRSDVAEQMRAASVLVLTSRLEGMPGVFVEAGLSGLPIVTMDVPGAHAVIDEGRSGFIVSQETPDVLADRLGELLVDPGLRAQMGAAALAHCQPRFSLQGGAERWRALLDGLLGRAMPAADG